MFCELRSTCIWYFKKMLRNQDARFLFKKVRFFDKNFYCN